MGVLLDRIARQSVARAHREYHDRIREVEARQRLDEYRDDDGYWFPASRRDNLIFAGILLAGAAAWFGVFVALIWFYWR